MFKKLVVLSTIALAACGGGGGDAPSAASNQQSLTFTGLLTAPIKLTTSDLDAGGRSFDIQAAYTGTTDKPLTIVAVDSSGLFDSAYIKSNVNGVGTFTLRTASSNKVGTYDSDVKIHACTSVKYAGTVGVSKIATCEGEYSGSPIILKRNIVINALTLDKTQLTFTSNAGDQTPAQVVTVNGATAAITASYMATSGPSAPIDAVKISIAGNQVSLQPTTKLAPGLYKGMLSISSKGFLSQYVPVEFNVGPVINHGLTFSPTSLTQLSSLSAPLGSTTSAKLIALNWTLKSPATLVSRISVNTLQPQWLQVPVAFDGLSGNLIFNPQGIAAKGSYTATVTVTSNTLGVTDVQTIPVNLTIN
ncbi:hypothetical protein [Deefgea rivuli]|uniref:hypothetical protein n=1 Tax=Deefgea rivuli TaxID=400948 RepID=UPI00048882CD|nr:hypothetical protein [Deefgea rivuli]